jgi:hypothetical protein
MFLTREERNAVYAAMETAFPDRHNLERFVDFELEEKLDHIGAANGSVPRGIWEVLKWAEKDPSNMAKLLQARPTKLPALGAALEQAQRTWTARNLPTPPTASRPAWNLVFLVFLLAAPPLWAFWFTDSWAWVALAAVLLGLGAFSFLWASPRLLYARIPGAALETLRLWCWRAPLRNWWGIGLCFVLLFVELGVFSDFGAVQVTNLQPGADRTSGVKVWIHKPGEARQGASWLAPQAALTSLRRAGLFSSSPYVVKVSGFPEKEIEVGAWGVRSVQIPDDLLRPVLLIACDETLSKTAINFPEDFQFLLTVDGREYRVDFKGSPVLIGCKNDLELPSYTTVALERMAMDAAVRDKLLARPVSLTPDGLPLRAGGGSVQVELLLKGEGVSVSRKTPVDYVQPGSYRQMVKLVVIYAR